MGNACLSLARGSHRPESEEEQDSALRESLLEKDLESGPPAAVERSWVSLFGTALVFVWPDDKWLKARRFTPASALHLEPLLRPFIVLAPISLTH